MSQKRPADESANGGTGRLKNSAGLPVGFDTGPQPTVPQDQLDALLTKYPKYTSGPKFLTNERLLRRRLNAVDELIQVYAEAYQHLVEELAVKASACDSKQPNGADAAMAEANDSAADTHAAKDLSASRPIATLRALQERVAQPSAELASVPAAADAATGEPAASTDRCSSADVPCFTDAEEDVLTLASDQTLDVTQYAAAIEGWKQKLKSMPDKIYQLERMASSAAARHMSSYNALAVLCGRNVRFLVRKSVVILGRCSSERDEVDIDLMYEGPAYKVSRTQAVISLGPDGHFIVENIGRRHLIVNNREVQQGQEVLLPHLSLIEVGGLSFLFMVNFQAVDTLLARAHHYAS